MNYKITIAITSFSNGEWKYYDIYDLESYLNAYKDFNQTLNKNDGDYETQLIETNLATIPDEEQLYFLFKLFDEYKKDYSINDIAILLNHFDDDEVTEILRDRTLFFVNNCNNKESAYQEYCEELDIYDTNNIYYDLLDWALIVRNFECSGGKIIEYKYNNYIIV